MLSLVDDLKQLNGMVERLSGGSCAYPPDELASKAAEFLCIHYLNLTRIIKSEATLSTDYEALVIRLGEVTTELEAAKNDVFKWQGIAELSHGEMAEQLEKAKRDAERYRWLKQNATETTGEFGEGAQLYFGTYRNGPLELDAAVDAAMRDSAREDSNG